MTGRIPQVVALTIGLCFADHYHAQSSDYHPEIAPASNEGAQAIGRFQLAAGLKSELFAAEPLLANPVAFYIDNVGRFYVVESFRHSAGVTDNRNHMYWLEDELACRTVADRVAMFKKHLKERISEFTIEHDRLRLIVDGDGDGVADSSTVFSDGYNGVPDGLASGVVVRNGKVWFACIPDLWQLEDKNADGVADVKKSLSSGYGVHVAFLGHDLHGLTFGPDGRLYFSVGDRGLNVKTPTGRLEYPDTGCVLRCNPDGSELEVFAYGLRNPQELAFDDYGNLFTGDNNSDSGDKARWVYLVEGGDSGWRIGYQYHELPGSRGPWNSERLWHPRFDGQAAYIVPPIAHLADGPSGLTYYPGTGLSSRYSGHFFLCDFRGDYSKSGVRSFSVEPDGAGFRLADSHKFVWQVLATDVDFGPDGGIYVTDWVQGWDKPKKGRIYRFTDPSADQSAVHEVRELLGDGMSLKSVESLVGFLSHADRRIRQEAQFELVARGADPELKHTVTNSRSQFARIHSMWGLEQMARKNRGLISGLHGLASDSDFEIRAQYAKMLGETRPSGALSQLLDLLKDNESRVRFHAAMSLGKLGQKEAGPAILNMLLSNSDRDSFLRHAGVMALVGIGDRELLKNVRSNPSKAIRLAAVVALRRLQDPLVAIYLDDPEPHVVQEAARAINDEPINGAMTSLASLSNHTGLDIMTSLRALNANYRLGQEAHALQVAAVAGRDGENEIVRLEALSQLRSWASPFQRDRVIGLYRPLKSRHPGAAVAALRSELGSILAGPEKVRVEAARIASEFGMKEVGPVLREIVNNVSETTETRVDALRGLESLEDPGLPDAVEKALRDKAGLLRAEARRLLVTWDESRGVRELIRAVEKGETIEQQMAIDVLGTLSGADVDRFLADLLSKLNSGNVSRSIELEILEATRERADFKSLLRDNRGTRPATPVGQYREALAGGNPMLGRRVFFEKTAVSCVRCHKIYGQGGEVGPDLSEVAKKNKTEHLLESVVDSNKKISEGFETLVIGTFNGKVLSGIVKSNTEKEVRLLTGQGEILVIPRSEIEDQNRGLSAMPNDLIQKLTRREVRDLVAFLATLDGSAESRASHGVSN